MRRVGIDFISVFGLPPVEFVSLAADLGCPTISTALRSMDFNPHGYAPWSLSDDKALRQAMVAAMAERGVSIALGEGLVVFPDRDVRGHAADLQAFAELGVRRIATLSFDEDTERAIDQFRTLADMAAEAGMEVVLEFTPSKKIATFADAREAVARVGRPNMKILVDTMHFYRSGSKPAEVAAAPADEIGYIQLCDSGWTNRFATYSEEGLYERMPPGAGELPLGELLAVLPQDVTVSLELPLRSQALAGVGPRERLKPSIEAAQRLLAEAAAEAV